MSNIDNAKELIDNAKIGQVVPIYKVISKKVDPFELFAKLSNYGNNKNSFFFESAEKLEKYGEVSLGSANPCLRIVGKDNKFEIKALNNLGKGIIDHIRKEFSFCKKLEKKKDNITGIFEVTKRNINESQRLRQKNFMEVIRKILFKFKIDEKSKMPNGGLFGVFSYDFIDHIEDLENDQNDLLDNPDFLFYFTDNLFVTDHKTNDTHIIVNAIITNSKKDVELKRCQKVLSSYVGAINNKLPKLQKLKIKKQKVEHDVTKEEIERGVTKIVQNIILGNIYKGTISKTSICEFNAEPLDIFKKLRERNPEPYMFFINDKEGVLIGGSHNSMSVRGDKEKIVEIRPSSGSNPRGFVNNTIDNDLDSRFESDLKVDKNILTDHTMMVDLARNDIARLSKSGTRELSNPFNIDKYSKNQHLISTIRGTLKDDIDVITGFGGLLNNGIVSGLPKLKSIQLIKEIEKNKRGFYGGTVCYFTLNNEGNGSIITSLLFLKNDKAYIRNGANINFDSNSRNSYNEIEQKNQFYQDLINDCGGFK